MKRREEEAEGQVRAEWSEVEDFSREMFLLWSSLFCLLPCVILAPGCDPFPLTSGSSSSGLLFYLLQPSVSLHLRCWLHADAR